MLWDLIILVTYLPGISGCRMESCQLMNWVAVIMRWLPYWGSKVIWYMYCTSAGGGSNQSSSWSSLPLSNPITSYVLLELRVGLLEVLLPPPCSEGRECAIPLEALVVWVWLDWEEEFRVLAVDMVWWRTCGEGIAAGCFESLDVWPGTYSWYMMIKFTKN